jgi:hypothetical protein
MCSIIGTFKKEKLIELVKLNQERGTFSYSLSTYNIEAEHLKIFKKSFGKFEFKDLPEENKKTYYIAHVQMPTDGLTEDVNRIHPSELISVKNDNESYLYHNGMLKDEEISRLQSKYKLVGQDWDTKLLHYELILNHFDTLDDVDGSFGCVFINLKNVYVFTTDTINLYIDKHLNLSSTEFKKSKKLKTNTVFRINFHTKELEKVTEFTSKSNPYYFAN